MPDNIEAMISDCPFAWTFEIIGPIGLGGPRWQCRIWGAKSPSCSTCLGEGDTISEAVRNAIDSANAIASPPSCAGKDGAA